MTAPSLKAKKFIVRFEEENDAMHQAAKAAAKSAHISLNSFILQAIDEKLNRGKHMDLLMDKLQESLRKMQDKGVIADNRLT